MLSDLIDQLGQELKMQDFITHPSDGLYSIEFKDDVNIDIFDYGAKFILKGILGPLPKQNVGDLLSKIMEANLFGQATEDGVIALEKDGSKLSFSLTLHEPLTYLQFREKVETFLNILAAWRTEIQGK